MKKIIIISQVVIILLLMSCANKSYYHAPTALFDSWRLWTGIILLVELILGLALSGKISAATFGTSLGTVIGTALVAFLMGYIIIGEWGIRILSWIMSGKVGIVILVILNLIGGVFALFTGTVSAWVLNAIHWHSVEVAKYAILPSLIGGIIQLILLANKKE